MAEEIRAQYQVSIYRACKIVGIPRSMYYYTHTKNDTSVIKAIQDHIREHPTHGFPKTFAYLRRSGQPWNHKKVYRVYRNLKLNLRRKGKKRLPARVKQPLEQVNRRNINWSIDFMQDSLMNGRKFRILNVIDDYNREGLTIEIGISLPSEHVIRILEQIIDYRGKPQRIRMDNGPEFISKTFELWCKQNHIEPLYIQPGRPMQNAFIERFNGSYRRDVLDAYAFFELDEVREITAKWLHDYNYNRPHESLNNLTPLEYAQKHLN